ncbi:MAG: hypothetical protein SO287_08395 [Parabacteroides sp.]|nr:hypothetical protein [Parabacteroides sp.]
MNELYCDKFGNVMMGIVDHGLVSLDEVFMRTYTQQGAGFGKGPIGGSIMSLCAEGDHIWIGTAESGLNLFNSADNTFKAIPSTQGMQIFSMTNYAPGKLLLSIFDVGLRIFDTATGKLTPLTLVNDSINRNVFRSGNGVYVWQNSPESILMIGISLYTYNSKTGQFRQPIAEREGLASNGTLKMVGTVGNVSYLVERKHLLQLDHSTDRPGAELRLYKLDAGSYTVQVSCTLNDGSWSPFQELVKFKVSAPWYRSGWFITVITLLTLLIVGGIVSFVFYQKQQRLKQELAQNRRRINEEKIDFLVNVSHELRTPLTLIYAPLNRMLQRTKPDAWNYRMLLTACRQSAHIMP